MSLILEALKKSEAERRLGHAPGLMDLHPVVRRRRGRGLALALVALVVVGVGGAAYWFGQRSHTGPTASPHTPTANEVVTETASPRNESLPAVESNVASPPTTPRAPGQSSERSAASSRLPSDPSFTSIEREARPQLPVALPVTPTAELTPAPASALPAVTPPAPTATAQITVQPDPAITAAVVEPAVEAPTIDPLAATAAAMPAPPSPPAIATPGAEVVSDLSSLGHEARGRLPPLKVSMHVYTEDPAGRVVIIDGRRLREGDPIDQRVRLVEIRRDGSVIELEGRRYRLPRP